MRDDELRLNEPEARAVEALRGLAHDPSPASRTRILAAVRSAAAETDTTATRHGRRRRRIFAGAFAALAVLLAGGSTAVVASADALPGGPGYGLRSVNEHVRVIFAGAPEKERLRLGFSARRIQQARQQLAAGDRADAASLLRDSGDYLQQAESGINEVGQSQRSNIESQLKSVASDEQQADGQLQQSGDQEHQDGGGGGTGNSPGQSTQGQGSNRPQGASPAGPSNAGADQNGSSGPTDQNK